MANEAATVDYRALLEDERNELLERLAEIGYRAEGGVSDHTPSYDSNFADTSQVTAERGEAEALAIQLRETLNEVLGALERLDAGTYGSCEKCGNPIQPARLEAKPAARLCISCASSN